MVGIFISLIIAPTNPTSMRVMKIMNIKNIGIGLKLTLLEY